MATVKPRIIDLFSGCGGFGLGAELAGFHSTVAVDIDPDLQSAYRLNFPSTRPILSDIGKLDREAWSFIMEGQQVDGVIGGPPCQGFSRMGKREAEDPRNSLIGHFFRNIEIIRPKFFVMENVEGLLDNGNIEKLQEAISTVSGTYSVIGPMTINALHYGAPTSRRRVIVVGYDRRYVDEIDASDFPTRTDNAYVTVSEAIRDLPQPVTEEKGEWEYGWSRYPNANNSDKDLSAYARVMRSLPTASLGWKTAIERMANGQTSGHFGTAHSPAVIRRFSDTLGGKIEPVSRYPRLAWDSFCPTLRAGTGVDRGSFQAMRPIHPSQPRVITVREAARLQGFPDWFTFHKTKWHSFRMIGNSVSPLVGKGVLSVIRQKMCQAVAPARSRA
jgi:DNA (cytosine-5)-methyltransferase 1